MSQENSYVCVHGVSLREPCHRCDVETRPDYKRGFDD
jgi:hypothetical protein